VLNSAPRHAARPPSHRPQQVYTAGTALPGAVVRTQYHHRSLNPTKLIDVGFSSLRKNQTLASVLRATKLPTEFQTPGLREMRASDAKRVGILL
jgi:glycylpeptide N-tetradecanoyltransferase